jgi:hypothetical protein
LRSRHSYPLHALARDYAGAAAGFGISAGLLLFAHVAVPVAWFLGGSTALFLVYFARTVCRHLTRIELDETGIRAAGPAMMASGASIRWDGLCALRLDYYSTRADRERGWMQLKLADAQHTIRIDSDLEGFAQVVEHAAREAARRALELEPSTVSNLQALRP